jgi:hypothetical protein
VQEFCVCREFHWPDSVLDDGDLRRRGASLGGARCGIVDLHRWLHKLGLLSP